MPEESFTHRFLPGLGRSVHRLGIGCNYGIDERGFEYALDQGINYVFWTATGTRGLKPVLRRAIAAQRDRLVIATGPSVAYFGGNVRRTAERLLEDLGTDYLDVFHLFWLGVSSAWTEGTLDALRELKAAGKIRKIGISIHDRERAGRLAVDPTLDLLMLRYNAAHPGAERDVFPHLSERKPTVVAYTATSWGKLLRSPRGYQGPVMNPGDCYRFCLSSPHVDLVLTGPRSQRELEENLAGLARGPLSADESEWMRRFGAAVHG